MFKTSIHYRPTAETVQHVNNVKIFSWFSFAWETSGSLILAHEGDVQPLLLSLLHVQFIGPGSLQRGNQNIRSNMHANKVWTKGQKLYRDDNYTLCLWAHHSHRCQRDPTTSPKQRQYLILGKSKLIHLYAYNGRESSTTLLWMLKRI
jgi:hypothetical protein